jgi:hypothetical protein
MLTKSLLRKPALVHFRSSLRRRFHDGGSVLYPAGVADSSLKDVPMSTADPLLALIPGAEHSELGGVQLDIVRTGNARVKRSIYPPGFHWARDIKPLVGTDTCMHAHVGFLARGRIHMEFPDGCTVEYVAPQVVVIEPGHDGRVIGDEPAILIEFDFEGETAVRLGLPERHLHGT